MKRLRENFAGYLKRIGRYDVTLGPGDEHPVTKEDSQFLTQSLSRQMKSDNYLIVIAILILFLSLAAVFFLLLSNRQNPQMIKLVSGAAVFLTLGSVRWLHRLWREKTFTAISLAVLDQMPPREAADVITLFYWSFMQKPSGLRAWLPGASASGPKAGPAG